MEAQKQVDDEEKEKPETQRSSNEEEMKERSDESTIHTVPGITDGHAKGMLISAYSRKSVFLNEINTLSKDA